jgi:nuclear pore complex protein Nup210
MLFEWLAEAKLATPHKGLGIAALLLPWMIWKHQNGCVFEGAQPSISRLMAKIKEEAALWAQAAPWL